MTQNLNRRTVITASALAATALAAGSSRPGVAQDASPDASPAAQRTPILAGDPIAIYDSGADLPTDTATLTWLENGSGPRTDFMADLFTAYSQAHPNIAIQYDHFPVPDQQELLSVAIQNGTMPDVFQLFPNLPGSSLVAQGLVAPLDDIIPDFAAWKATFPPNTFFPGINVFNDKTYTFPITSNQWLTNALLFSPARMEAAGYDPVASPMSWDDFREAARKITEAGKGESFGLLIGGKQTNTLGEVVTQFAQLAGAAGGEFDWSTGKYNLTADQFVAAIELFVAITKDGSIFPGSMQLSNSDAREYFPQGIAGMYLQGQWNIPQWATRNADFEFDVAFQPLADPATGNRLTYEPGGANQRFVSATTPNGAIAGDILHYLGSIEGQVAWGIHTQGSDPPLFEAGRQAAAGDPRMQRVNELTATWMMLGPSAAVRNPGVAQVNLERKPVTPTLGDIVQGCLSGQVPDVAAALKDLNDRSEAELDRAIAAAVEKGADVSRDDWVFPNWDPTADYTEDFYQAL